MATRTISATGGTWTATTAWIEGVVPTTSDYIIGNSSSGPLQLGASRTVQGWDFSQYASTLTMGNFNLIGNVDGYTAAFGTGFTVSKTYGASGFQVSNASGTMSVVCNGRNVEYIEIRNGGAKRLVDDLYTQYLFVATNFNNPGTGSIFILNGSASTVPYPTKTYATGSHCSFLLNSGFANLEINCDTINLPTFFDISSINGYTASYTWIKGTFSGAFGYNGGGYMRFSGVLGQNVFINSWKDTISGTVSFIGNANFSYVLGCTISCGSLFYTNATPGLTTSTATEQNIDVYDRFQPSSNVVVPMSDKVWIRLRGTGTSSIVSTTGQDISSFQTAVRIKWDTPGTVNNINYYFGAAGPTTLQTYRPGDNTGRFVVSQMPYAITSNGGTPQFFVVKGLYGAPGELICDFNGLSFSNVQIVHPYAGNTAYNFPSGLICTNLYYTVQDAVTSNLAFKGTFSCDRLWGQWTMQTWVDSIKSLRGVLQLESGSTYTINKGIFLNSLASGPNGANVIQSSTASSPAYILYKGAASYDIYNQQGALINFTNFIDIQNIGNTIYALTQPYSYITLTRTTGITLVNPTITSGPTSLTFLT